MKRINLAMMFVLFFGLVAASCASVTKDIRVEGAHDPKVNFGAFKTYTFVGVHFGVSSGDNASEQEQRS